MTATTYPFSAQERLRLETYRAAVAAGFYSEFPGRARRTDVRLLRRLLHPRPEGEPSVPEYPFTQAELERLAACRGAIAHGYYSDDGPAELQ
jgi:hypothetical protein